MPELRRLVPAYISGVESEQEIRLDLLPTTPATRILRIADVRGLQRFPVTRGDDVRQAG